MQRSASSRFWTRDGIHPSGTSSPSGPNSAIKSNKMFVGVALSMVASIKTYVPIPRVERVRRRLSDGTSNFHYYHRPTGFRLPAPDDPSFIAAYESAERRLTKQEPKRENRIMPELPAETFSSRERTPRHELEMTFNDSVRSSAEEIQTSQYHTPEEVSHRWRNKVDVDTMKNWRSLGVGPPFHRFGRAVLYRADFLESWESKSLTVTDGDTRHA